MRVIGIIPARYQSSRLEGKPLALIHGKPMVQHVYERARMAHKLHEILVATDDQRILEAVANFGGKALMTSAKHRSGTDRVAEAAAAYQADVVVNIQGDEPMLDPLMIDEVVEPFLAGTSAPIVTLKKEVFEDSEFADPGVVKVVCDPIGRALYFSRSLIPYPQKRTTQFRVFEHVGLYAFTRECLIRFASLPVSPMEEIESLEQLRALENGIPILVVETRSRTQSISVDTEADLERVREALATQDMNV
jgi:3-deoxy-manno-octulosonate cytidylyltransferase (CMP-KDO synthetase)